MRFALNPWLTIVRTTDALALQSNANDHSSELQDGDTTDVAFDAQDTAANDDYIYVGAVLPFRGCAVRVGSDPQNSASVLTVKYWNGGVWVDISDSDGTEAGGCSMAQHGNVTWTVPSAWKRASLNAIGDVSSSGDCAGAKWAKENLYWTRWEFSASTEASWNLSQLRALNRSTAYGELIEGQVFECAVDPHLVGCVEALTNAGTANVIVNAGVLETSVTGKQEEFA